jgi:toxin-antitoxin system PIN domain toxin
LSRYLLDVNVLLALHRPSHEAHRTVIHWFGREGQTAFSTCAMTQAGFVRLMMNPQLSERKVAQNEARRLLDELTQRKGHSFWDSGISFLEATAPLASSILGHRQITDAYLLGVAIYKKGVLATLDKATRHLAGDEFGRNVLVIE